MQYGISILLSGISLGGQYALIAIGYTMDPDTGCSTRGMGIATLAKHRNGATGKVYYGYNPSMTKIGEFEGVHVAVPGKSYKEKKDEGKIGDIFGGAAR